LKYSITELINTVFIFTNNHNYKSKEHEQHILIVFLYYYKTYLLSSK